VRVCLIWSLVFTLANIQPQLEASLAAKKAQVDPVTVDYNIVKERHSATQTTLASVEDVLETPRGSPWHLRALCGWQKMNRPDYGFLCGVNPGD